MEQVISLPVCWIESGCFGCFSPAAETVFFAGAEIAFSVEVEFLPVAEIGFSAEVEFLLEILSLAQNFFPAQLLFDWTEAEFSFGLDEKTVEYLPVLVCCFEAAWLWLERWFFLHWMELVWSQIRCFWKKGLQYVH